MIFFADVDWHSRPDRHNHNNCYVGGDMMVHADVLARYNEIFGDTLGIVDTWFQNGKNSIRLKFDTGKQLIFTVGPSGVEWRLETRQYFENELRRNH